MRLTTHELATLRIFRAILSGDCSLDCVYADDETENVCACSCEGQLHGTALSIDAYGRSVATVTGLATLHR